MEVEKLALERTLADKEAEYARVRGGKYMKRDDFRQYQANIRAKHNQYKEMKKQLQELKAESNVLTNTRTILSRKAEDLGIAVKELEAERGISGYTGVEAQIQGVSNQKEMLDNAKDETLQEITEMVEQIGKEITDRKTVLAPQIIKFRNMRSQAQELQAQYGEKKKKYDNVVEQLNSE